MTGRSSGVANALSRRLASLLITALSRSNASMVYRNSHVHLGLLIYSSTSTCPSVDRVHLCHGLLDVR